MALGEDNKVLEAVSSSVSNLKQYTNQVHHGTDRLADVDPSEGRPPMIAFTEMPDDVLFMVLLYCDLRTLGRLGSVCKRLNELAKQDCVWVKHKQRLTVVHRNNCNMSNKYHAKSVKEQCRVSENWKNGQYKVKEVLSYRARQMSCMQLYNDRLWISHNNNIEGHRFTSKSYPLLCTKPDITLTSPRTRRTDVSKFVCRDNMIVSGSIDGSVTACSSYDGCHIAHYGDAHVDDVLAIDCCNDVIVSGSRDQSVKVWHTTLPNNQALKQTISVGDKVCSIAIDSNGRSFTIGSSGLNCSPLHVWDFQRMERLCSLGSGYKFGAGVLDVQYETSDVLLTCGYDTLIRIWDLRVSYTSCMLSWEEPFDSAFYCIRSDGNNAIIAGTSHYGLVHLWDKRNSKKQVQMYYVGYRSSSPVYSLVFDSTYLYVALDRGIHALNFY